MAASTTIVSWIAGAIFNYDSQRFQKASLDTRTEGWTETWGIEREGTASKAGVETESVPLSVDCQSICLFLSTKHPQLDIILTQHRPAWFEQMLMRVAGLPHIVLNSTHVSNEATGQLPYLTDCTSSKPPVLVGRNHPSNFEKNENMGKNSILAYLQCYRGIDLDRDAKLATNQLPLLKSFHLMITSELSNILLQLRFEDANAWEKVYLEQYITASVTHSSVIEKRDQRGTMILLRRLQGRLQALMERAIERQRLMGPKIGKSVPNLLARANDAYSALEEQLSCITERKSGKGSDCVYLLGTDTPALVDVCLWAHLAEALCDIHLVIVLATYPRLLKYFEDMHRTYFCDRDKNSSWAHWNDKQNLQNAFQKIPTLTERRLSYKSSFKDAIEFMQNSALQKQNFQEVLKTAKAIRENEDISKPRESSSYRIYRWSMGDTSLKSSPTSDNGEENPLRKKLIRDQTRTDQLWMSGILGVSAIAIILIQSGKS